MNTIASILDKYQDRLDSSDTPLLDCQILLSHILGEDRTWLYAHHEKELTRPQIDHFKKLFRRRKKGEPVAYLTGVKEFWSIPLKVTSATLIPRPETEFLVRVALNRFPDVAMNVADLGTGSGAIAIALANERSSWKIWATDISEETISVAVANGQSFAPNRVNWSVGDWCNHLPHGFFDLLVCNPPYIATGDAHLEVLKYEPSHALVSGTQGMDDFNQIIPQTINVLRPGGYIILEHGYDQQDLVVGQLDEAGFELADRLKDCYGNPRVVIARLIP